MPDQWALQIQAGDLTDRLLIQNAEVATQIRLAIHKASPVPQSRPFTRLTFQGLVLKLDAESRSADELMSILTFARLHDFWLLDNLALTALASRSAQLNFTGPLSTTTSHLLRVLW